MDTLLDAICLLLEARDEHKNEKRHDLILCWDNGLGVKFDDEGKATAVSLTRATDVGFTFAKDEEVFNGNNVQAQHKDRAGASWRYARVLDCSIQHLMGRLYDQVLEANACDDVDVFEQAQNMFFDACIVIDPEFEQNDTHGASIEVTLDAAMEVLGYGVRITS